MSKKKLTLIVGTRPNYIKVAALIRELRMRKDLSFLWQIINFNQHHDHHMSCIFHDYFKYDAEILNIHYQHGNIYSPGTEIMDYLKEHSPDYVMVFGDCDCTLAGALAAGRLKIPIIHYEAGYRCRDLKMIEEQNRVIVDAISEYFFVAEETCVNNLKHEGKQLHRIYLTGDIMVDSLLQELKKDPVKVGCYPYGVLTVHRAENVDTSTTLKYILSHVSGLPLSFKWVAHHRALLTGIRPPENIIRMNPMGYFDFINLCRQAQIIITDSGGLQTEAMIMGVPCLTLRERTEKLSTLLAGGNCLVGTDPDRIKEGYDRAMTKNLKPTFIPDYFDGKASQRMVDYLQEIIV